MSQVKVRLHKLLGPASDVDEEDELEKATEVNKQLMEAIAMAQSHARKSDTKQLKQQSLGWSS